MNNKIQYSIDEFASLNFSESEETGEFTIVNKGICPVGLMPF